MEKLFLTIMIAIVALTLIMGIDALIVLNSGDTVEKAIEGLMLGLTGLPKK